MKNFDFIVIADDDTLTRFRVQASSVRKAMSALRQRIGKSAYMRRIFRGFRGEFEQFTA